MRPTTLLARFISAALAAPTRARARRAARPGSTTSPTSPKGADGDRARGAGGTARSGPRAGVPAPRGASDAAPSTYPGDFIGDFRPVYAPQLDGEADPGEIVWTWVPYEEDPSRGKDRPVLVVGRDSSWLLALMLTSKDHDTQPERRDEVWLDLGVGEWDARGRESEVRIDRVVRIDPAAIRREGAVLDRTRFGEVASALERAARRRQR